MINIRKATRNDIEQFKAVIKSSILEFCKDFYTPDQLKALLGQFPGYDLYAKWIDERVLIVAEKDKYVVGFAQYCPDTTSTEAVHVSPKYAGNGIGSELVKNIEEVARNQGAHKITLGSSLNALEFYSKCGYEKKEVAKYKCKNGVTLETVTYEKEINS